MVGCSLYQWVSGYWQSLQRPLPLSVWLLPIVGFRVVAQQTPFAVMVPPPVSDISPPEEADEYVRLRNILSGKNGKTDRMLW